jgi:hypothetical protein
MTEQEFDNLMSTEYKLTKLISPEMLTYDPLIFEKSTQDLDIGSPNIGAPSHYTPEEKVRACIVHTCTGSISKTVYLTNVPTSTLVKWRNLSNWWPVIRDQVQKIRNDILESKLTEVIEEATDAILDRIENGDEVYNHATGEKTRVKVNMNSLAQGALKTAFEKREDIRGSTLGTGTKKDVVEHLKRLADAFETMVSGTKVKPSTVEGEFSEIVT